MENISSKGECPMSKLIITGLHRYLQNIYLFVNGMEFKNADAENIFTNIYHGNAWHGKDSVSGTGSDTYQTRVVIRELPEVFVNFNIATMLDIPCGDFHWMSNVNTKSINYIGADIVNDLVGKNREKFRGEKVSFQKLDLMKDKLPKVDLVFCRDCLVHLSFKDIFLALHNICNSESKYLLTTTFTDRKKNHDIRTGQWRVINLEVAPFLLPRPLKIINEECTEDSGNYKDKSLGLWRIEDIRESLTKHCTC
jgi:hypothetical protein